MSTMSYHADPCISMFLGTLVAIAKHVPWGATSPGMGCAIARRVPTSEKPFSLDVCSFYLGILVCLISTH